MNDLELNHRAADLTQMLLDELDSLRIGRHILDNGTTIFDFGINSTGGLSAGIELADICMAGLSDCLLSTQPLFGNPVPWLTVATDQPLAACLFSQYAGHAVKGDGFFAMGSGPIRAAIGTEEIFERQGYHEECEHAIAVLETSKMPTVDVANDLAKAAGVETSELTLLVAPVTSIAGTVQVVARSVETAMHQLMENDVDLTRIVSGFGSAPLPPVSPDELVGIGLTNDAILSCGEVTFWVTGDDSSIEEFGPKIPANASDSFGKPFLELFKAAGNDFYALDPSLFAPAVVTFQNIETGSVFRFGETLPELLQKSIAAAAGRK